MTSLCGKHVIVTGGGSGVGAAIARRLAAAGATVTITGRQEAPIAAMATKYSGIDFIVCDARDSEGTKHMVAEVARRHGPASILIANAGAAESKPLAKLTAADVANALDTNLMSVFHLWSAGLASLHGARWGRLVAVASMAGLKGYPYVAGYVAAKHAVVGLTRAVALEVARSGITANAVCPGFIDTPMLERSLATITAHTGRSREDARAALTSGNPQGRLISPDEVADCVLWLCSDGAASINGQAIAISGGET